MVMCCSSFMLTMILATLLSPSPELTGKQNHRERDGRRVVYSKSISDTYSTSMLLTTKCTSSKEEWLFEPVSLEQMIWPLHYTSCREELCLNIEYETSNRRDCIPSYNFINVYATHAWGIGNITCWNPVEDSLADLDGFLQFIALPKLHGINVVKLNRAKRTLRKGGSLMLVSIPIPHSVSFATISYCLEVVWLSQLCYCSRSQNLCCVMLHVLQLVCLIGCVCDQLWLFKFLVWCLQNYITYVKIRYDSRTFVVFDGYSEIVTNTKVSECQRRSALQQSIDLVVSEDIAASVSGSECDVEEDPDDLSKIIVNEDERVTRLETEPGSPWWKASSLSDQPPLWILGDRPNSGLSKGCMMSQHPEGALIAFGWEELPPLWKILEVRRVGGPPLLLLEGLVLVEKPTCKGRKAVHDKPRAIM
ncbi:hypothetical protein PR048_016600 [Dryococelus australis]|uniref:Uncharacterized protein n=1 Tax=Dryococelus australis TaxID=614101 RepID=A0ABQ9H7A3_9NEOP|nr:hypothetical protein PR048_016600 [Dryococelus australis]